MSGVAACDGRRWKIALVSPYDYAYPGGVTEHVAHLAAQFRRRGHDVHVIAPASAALPGGADEPILHRIGHIVPVPASGSVARIALSLRGYRRVKALLQREQFDIIHLHEPLMPALPLTVLRHSHTLNIGTFHAYRNSGLMYFYGRLFLRPFFRKLDGLVAVSRAARDFVAAHFPGDYRIIPNGIDYAYFHRRARPIEAYQDGKLNVLFVGRLEKRKGLAYLLRAWPQVRAQVKNARLIVVGGGRALPKYRAAAMQHGWHDVVFTGHVSRADLARYYHTADVFCAPSTGQESFGIVLLEAMAAGRAIVTSDIPGYREVLTDGCEGILVPPKDHAALAVAIVRLLQDPEWRSALGRRGTMTARRYSWEKVAGQVLDYYAELVTSQRSGVRDAVRPAAPQESMPARPDHLVAR